MKKIIVSLSITIFLFSCNTNSNQKMEEKVTEIYEDFESRRKAYDAKIADEEDLKDL